MAVGRGARLSTASTPSESRRRRAIRGRRVDGMRRARAAGLDSCSAVAAMDRARIMTCASAACAGGCAGDRRQGVRKALRKPFHTPPQAGSRAESLALGGVPLPELDSGIPAGDVCARKLHVNFFSARYMSRVWRRAAASERLSGGGRRAGAAWKVGIDASPMASYNEQRHERV